MKVTVDEKNDVMRIKFQSGKYAISKEVDEGIILDLSSDHKLLAIEIIGVSERLSKQSLKQVISSA